MPGWSGEVCHLIFSGTPRYDYESGYLSTEGKILRGLRGPTAVRA